MPKKAKEKAIKPKDKAAPKKKVSKVKTFDTPSDRPPSPPPVP